MHTSGKKCLNKIIMKSASDSRAGLFLGPHQTVKYKQTGILNGVHACTLYLAHLYKCTGRAIALAAASAFVVAAV